MSTEIPINVTREQLENQLRELQQKVAEIEDEKNGLETLLEVVTEHSTDLENRIHQQNRQMTSYIEQVKKVTAAAIAVQSNNFSADSLSTVAERTDELGNLARVFVHTVKTVKAHEQELIEANQTLADLLDASKRFVPYEYLKFLHKDSIVNVQLGDHVSKEMAVMFSDLRSFTTLSESMTPQENFDFINAYLQQVSPEIRSHNGFIVKYLGDGMMAVFPERVEDAIQAGIAKLKQVEKYNHHREQQGCLPIHVGIGIHAGHMMVGIVGEFNRMQGDAFSDNVNLTARLEGLTKYYGVSLLISENVVQKLNKPDQYQLRFLDRAIVKGRSEAISVYQVLDAEIESVRAAKIQLLPIYQQGVSHYQQGNLEAAKDCFKEVLTTDPLDTAAMLYLDRLEQLKQQGLPENWRGVWIFTQK